MISADLRLAGNYDCWFFKWFKTLIFDFHFNSAFQNNLSTLLGTFDSNLLILDSYYSLSNLHLKMPVFVWIVHQKPWYLRRLPQINFAQSNRVQTHSKFVDEEFQILNTEIRNKYFFHQNFPLYAKVDCAFKVAKFFWFYLNTNLFLISRKNA